MVDECLCVSKREREEWRVLFQLLCVFAGENKQLYDLICALMVWAFYFILLNSRVSNVCVYDLHVNNSIEYFSDLSGTTLAFLC